ncbi:hypothetical protein Godav_028001, partial [Gossypium davidsonii]|nr:hypothetical protein [Gossypium davidsonii]MBA0654079.1 hypothetical protein [Gossypium klotzschianum]
VADGIVCPRCRSGEEDVSYVFRFCPTGSRNKLMHERKIELGRELSMKFLSIQQKRFQIDGESAGLGSDGTEAYAGLHAVKLGISMGLHSVTIKGDSRTIIKKCQTKAQDKSVIGAIISDIQRESEYFQEISFQFINGTENSLAHRIAKEALRREEETHLEGEALHCLQMSLEGIWRRFPN